MNKSVIKQEYQGKNYTLRGNKWFDESGMVAPSSIQSELNYLNFSEEVLNETDIGKLIEYGDRYKNSSSIALAIKCYRRAIELAELKSENEIRYILPRLTSCLRDQGKPEVVVEIFSSVKNKYGKKIFNHVLLTSVAAAFCDLQEYDKAKKCCDHAFALSGGKASGELMSVYGRIKKETNSKDD